MNESKNGVTLSQSDLEIRDKKLGRVCLEFGVDKDVLLGKYRGQEIVPARIALSKLLREYGFSDTKVGKMMNRHRTVIIYYDQQFDIWDTTYKHLNPREKLCYLKTKKLLKKKNEHLFEMEINLKANSYVW